MSNSTLNKLQGEADVFIRATMRTVRALHPDDRRAFLVFLLHEVGDKPWAEPIRDLLTETTRLEGQFELWAQGQLRLSLPE